MLQRLHREGGEKRKGEAAEKGLEGGYRPGQSSESRTLVLALHIPAADYGIEGR